MATFRNQATLAYNGQTTQSNVAVGDIISSLTVTKTAVANSYRVGDKVTYVQRKNFFKRIVFHQIQRAAE